MGSNVRSDEALKFIAYIQERIKNNPNPALPEAVFFEDTAIKQEALADLDDDIANYGPNWWRGEGMTDGPMGFDSRQQATSNIITKINNGIVDDLERAGVDEEKVSFIFRNLSETRDRLKNDPKAFVQKVADELEFEDIDYDLTFWNKYVDEIMSRMQKPEPRFMFGGAV